MKSAQLELDGKPINEVMLILNPAEVKIIHKAVMMYAATNKRKKTIAKVLDNLELCNIFF